MSRDIKHWLIKQYAVGRISHIRKRDGKKAEFMIE
jgi:hypothetical protein